MSHNFFRVKTQFENLGDALINRELLKLLNTSSKLSVCIANVPQKFIENLDLNAPNIVLIDSVPLFYFSLLKSALSPGTTNLFLNPGGYGGEISLKKTIAYLVTSFLFIAFKLFGIKVNRVGISYSNMSAQHARMLRFQAPILFTNAVRDTISALTCQNLNIKTTDVVPDLAFSLDYHPGDVDKPYEYILSFRESEKNNSQLLKILDQLIEQTDGKILLAYQVKFDKAFQEQLLSRYKGKNIEIKDICSSLVENQNLFSQCRYVVSNRLHVLLLAMSRGALPVTIIDPIENAKIVGIFNDAGFGNCLVNYQTTQQFSLPSISAEQIKNQFIKNQQKLKDFFKEKFNA